MKKVYVASLISLFFVGSAQSMVITPDHYELTDISGTWYWAQTDYILNVRPPLTNADLATVDTILSDGYTFVPGGVSDINTVNGIANFTPDINVLTFEFDADYDFGDISVQYSSAIGFPGSGIPGTVENTVRFFDDGTPTGLAGTQFINPYSHNPLNPTPPPSDTLQFFNLYSGDALTVSFTGDIILHEIVFDGIMVDPGPGPGPGPGDPVPEPTTMLLFGTGLVGLVGLRMRKKKK